MQTPHCTQGERAPGPAAPRVHTGLPRACPHIARSESVIVSLTDSTHSAWVVHPRDVELILLPVSLLLLLGRLVVSVEFFV